MNVYPYIVRYLFLHMKTYSVQGTEKTKKIINVVVVVIVTARDADPGGVSPDPDSFIKNRPSRKKPYPVQILEKNPDLNPDLRKNQIRFIRLIVTFFSFFNISNSQYIIMTLKKVRF